MYVANNTGPSTAGKGHLAALSRRRSSSVSAERFVDATVTTPGCEVTTMEPVVGFGWVDTVGASSGVVMARVVWRAPIAATYPAI